MTSIIVNVGNRWYILLGIMCARKMIVFVYLSKSNTKINHNNKNLLVIIDKIGASKPKNITLLTNNVLI